MRSLLLSLLLGITLLTSAFVFAEEKPQDFLPIGLTEEEMTRLNEIGINFQRTAPPPGVMHSVAEWEPMRAVLIRWPLGLSVAIVKEMAEDCIVYTLVANSSEQASAVSSYTAGGVNMANCQFIIAATNSIWTRDYGPWFVFDGFGNIGIVDPIYNRPRPQDDVIPTTLGSLWGIPVYALPLATPGGNHMCDGIHTSMASNLIYDENNTLSHAQVDAYIQQYLGNNHVVWDKVETSGIHHIDCWAKMLDPGTILVKQTPASHAFSANYNARADSMSHLMSPWGKPYKVVRVYCPTSGSYPNGAAYTNSLILNKKVLVPIFSLSTDDSALATYRNAMPGYEVIGFTGSWLDNDALHCRAMGIADPDMIYIAHVPLQTTSDSLNDYPVSANIYAHSDGQFITDSMKIYYSVNSGPFSYSPLLSTAEPDSFYGFIPHQAPGSQIRYFLKAADDSGKLAMHPLMGEPAAHQFRVNMPPQITSGDSIIMRTPQLFGFYPAFVDIDDAAHTISYPFKPAWLSVSHDSLTGSLPVSPVVDSFKVVVADAYSSDALTVVISTYKCGDTDGSGSVDISDVVMLIAYIFGGGPAPSPLDSGDADCSGGVDISDAVYLITHIFGGGPAPCDGC